MVCSIREKYNTPSFFEMIDKTRSETAHSAFLSWMLNGQGISDSTADTPLYLFLLNLSKRSLQQESGVNELMNPVVRDAVLSRKIKISNAKADTEVQISDLAELAYDSFDPSTDADHQQYLSDIIATVTDRVDVVVKCDVDNCQNIKHLIIVIENKVDSNEGQSKAKRVKAMPQQYSALSQTERYYDASYQKSNSDTAIIYVFLNSKLTANDLKGLPANSPALKADWKIAQSDHFININYQDILNGIIDNLLSLQEGSVTARTRNFLEEYKNEITYPHIENPKTHQNIAYPEIEGIEDLWEEFRFLFHCIAYSTLSSKGCVAIEEGGCTSYCSSYQGRVTIPNSLQSLFGNRNGEPIKRTSVINFCNTLSQNDIECVQIDSNTLSEAGVSGLLSDFADENLEILSTIISAIRYSSARYEAEANGLFDVLMGSARDNTTYFVWYKGNKLTPKPVAKSEVAFLILKQWAVDNQATLLDMRNAFPVSVNPYYASQKYFKELFYLFDRNLQYYYDGVDPKFINSKVQVTSNWDFYLDSVHNYLGITNLKLWRKDAFDSLIDHVKKNHSAFANDLSIVDASGETIL